MRDTGLILMRKFSGILVGLIAWYAIVILADYLLVTELRLGTGARFSLLGIVELVLGGMAVILALRLAGIVPSDIGWTVQHAREDLLIGLVVAAGFAALQFLILIPATGGATRSDIVANAAQIGDTVPGLLGVLVLALCGSTSEELLFRGLLLGGLALLAGGSAIARAVATGITVLLFGLSHGYQGWAGVIDTGLNGGLLLSLLYWARGARLAAPIAAHAGWNAIAAVVIFLQ